MIKSAIWNLELSPLSRRDMDRIHQSTLDVLENVGIIMPLDEGRRHELFDAGVKQGAEKDRLFFPGWLVEKALAKAPAGYTLCAVDPENDLPLDGRHGYLTTDGSATELVDLDTGDVRISSKKDLAEISLLADKAPQISFLWPSVSARDCSPKVQALHELQTVMENTGKHVQAMTATDPLNAAGTVEMAAVLAGGKDSLRKRPIISNFQCSLSPLSYDGKGLDSALIFAEAGVPVGFMTMQLGCSTAPATLAGNLILGNAEILAGIVMVELCYPGAPTFYGSCATMMELKRGGVTCSGPEDLLLQSVSAQMARYYRIPSNIGTFCSSSKSSDWQAGIENGFSSMSSVLSRADMMCGAGLICAARIFSPAQMLLDCEAFDLLRGVAKGMDVDDETMAVDAIKRVGSSHYMTDEHTIRHLSGVWQSDLIDRGSYSDWELGGKKNAADRAREKAKGILADNTLNERTHNKKVLDEIIAEYEKR